MNNSTNSSVAPMTGEKTEYPEPLASHIFRLFLYAIIFLLTVGGNTLVINIVLRRKELHSVTGYLICNLSIADLGVGLICLPFTLTYAELTYWPFGLALCKIIPYFQAAMIMASVATLSAISFDRFRTIVYPYEPRISISKVKFIIAGIWFLAFLVNLPVLVVMKTLAVPNLGLRCDEFGWPSEQYREVYTVVSFVLTYAMPLPLMAIWYAIVIFKLEKAAKETSDQEGFKVAKAKGKVVRMLITVVVAYFICYLPYHVVWLWFEFGKGSLYRYYWVLLSYTQVLVYSNSFTNPILYCFFSEQFRRGFSNTCRCRSTRRKSRRAPISRQSQVPATIALSTNYAAVATNPNSEFAQTSSFWL